MDVDVVAVVIKYARFVVRTFIRSVRTLVEVVTKMILSFYTIFDS